MIAKSVQCFFILLLFPLYGNCETTVLERIQYCNGTIATTSEITSTSLQLYSTFKHISIHLEIEGDVNLNSTLEIQFRLKGETEYKSGADAMRAHPDMIVNGNALNKNFHASSALFLQANSEYELKITLMDSDGGGTVIDTSLFTKKYPTPFIDGEILFVAPGNGGGDGSAGNPFLGIQAAVDAVQPGDIIKVTSGGYTPFTIQTSGTSNEPITIQSEVLHGAILDGAGTNNGIVTIGNFSDSTQHIILDGFEITNGRWGIDAQNTQHISIINNNINQVDFGIVNRRENGWEHNQWIENNLIVGKTTWPGTGIPSERGIDIRGNNNVVSFNTISDFGDGISTDGAAYEVSYSLDIYGNDITRVVDDLIEVDGMISNTRIYNNQCYNGRAGVSVAPVFGGPVYIFRNVFYNLEFSGIKMNRSSAGLYVVNNTIVSDLNGLSSPAGWQNTYFRNNAIVSSRYCFEEYGLVVDSIDDWNYNGYKSTRAGTSAQPWFKWDNIKYNDVEDLANNTNIESNGIAIDFTDFNTVFIPTPFTNEVDPTATNVTPSSGSILINSGMAINNLNDPFVTDAGTDIGAIEFGSTTPIYGHDFSTVCSYSDLSSMTWQGTKSGDWFDPANWSPCGVPNKFSNVTIATNAAHYPILNTLVVVKSLNFNDASSLTVLGEDTILRVEN